MPRNIVLKVAYDGTRFLGWQKTNLDPKTFPTIESELEQVTEKILGHPIKLQAVSRTDRGVHAEAQVINFITTKESLDLARLCHSFNCLLPPDIRVLEVQLAPYEAFHATVDCKAKQYRYRIATSKTLSPFWRNSHWHFPYVLDLEKMQIAADLITGEHDFSAFRNFRKGIDYNDTVRTVFAIDIQQKEDDSYAIFITANNFLYKMARNIVGTIAYVGCGKLTCGHVADLFTNCDRTEAGMTAPACGLTLHKVFYADTFRSTRAKQYK